MLWVFSCNNPIVFLSLAGGRAWSRHDFVFPPCPLGVKLSGGIAMMKLIKVQLQPRPLSQACGPSKAPEGIHKVIWFCKICQKVLLCIYFLKEGP